MEVVTHEAFMQAIQNHLKQREGCPIIVLVHSPMGLEIQTNFMDFILQSGICNAGKITADLAFERATREGFKTGENKIMVQSIKDDTDPEKKKVN
jgi:hypothetical protein